MQTKLVKYAICKLNSEFNKFRGVAKN